MREIEDVTSYRVQFEDQLQWWAKQLYQTDTGLHQACRYALALPGKRVRPVLLMLVNQAISPTQNLAQCLPVACALEMIHSYSLIHDDLPCMDDDSLRRGQPTLHIAFDEATALLAGDSLLTDAFKVALSSSLEPKLLVAAVTCLTEAAGSSGMILGQDRDLFWTAKQGCSAEDLDQIHNLKTGRLIGAACQLGAIIANGSDDQIRKAGDFGQNLGLAFQIVDDLIDGLEGTGKSAGKDAAQNKLTYLSLMTREEAAKQAADLTEKAFAQLDSLDLGDSLEPLRTFGRALLARTF